VNSPNISNSSSLSEDPGHSLGTKRPRSRSSSLSDEDGSDDDRPLAARTGAAPGLQFDLNLNLNLGLNFSSQKTNAGTIDFDMADLDPDRDQDHELDPDADADADADAEVDIDADEASLSQQPNDAQPESPTHGKTAKSHTGLAPQTNTVSGDRLLPEKKAYAAAVAEANAKAEVRRTVGRADEGQQVDRLATGVTVDAGALTSVSILLLNM
jgi:hypothetical protein